MKFALIKEHKITGDARVLFSPQQLVKIIRDYPQYSFVVESSTIRAFSDNEYEQLGIKVVKDVSDADVFLGIKEVPLEHIIEGKTYFFFSHTTKMQPHNRWYLQGLKDKNISFYDYENFTDEQGKRLVAFGKNAGVIGAYHAFRTYGLKNKQFQIPKPSTLQSQKELLQLVKQHKLPAIKIIVTGTGNVGKGVVQFLEQLGVQKVGVNDFLNAEYNTSVYVQLSKRDYLFREEVSDFDETNFKSHPYTYKSDFVKFANKAHLLIAGHYYHQGMPMLFTQQDMQQPNFKINTIADISCDVFVPMPTCLRVTTPQKPVYGYNIHSGVETNIDNLNSIAVMAVDNLPCELPRESSIAFGQQFIDKLLPKLMKSLETPELQKGCVLNKGSFTPKFKYLEQFLFSKRVKVS